MESNNTSNNEKQMMLQHMHVYDVFNQIQFNQIQVKLISTYVWFTISFVF